MPEFADFVVQLREAFGDATLDEAVARGKASEPTFFARENGRTGGTNPLEDFNYWQVDAIVRDRHDCAGCDGSCVGTGLCCSEHGRSAVESRERVRTCR
ncbi:hypothetical protein AWB75_05869 [Caballeronia catudaia]|uniref:Uncharacterized protein n=1 Tax=Caballeronia catudaia TaxID=1777136 RepID=A0A158CWC4_9BURK|nr:hypothetical protein [Caballeronia catudaia]SAK86654.1 hypothetical protein AWB75_05869 [Caballeronia catudaia]